MLSRYLLLWVVLSAAATAGLRRSIAEQRRSFLSVTGGSKYTSDGQRWEELWDKQRACVEAEVE